MQSLGLTSCQHAGFLARLRRWLVLSPPVSQRGRASRNNLGDLRADRKPSTLTSRLVAALSTAWTHEDSACLLTRWAGGTVLALYALVFFGGLLLGDRGSALLGSVRSAVASGARAAGLGIDEVNLTGGSRLTNEDLADLLNLDANATALTFDVRAARERLLTVPWVDEASVRLQWPGKLEVRVVEREPFALWQRGGTVMMIDKQGREIGPYADKRFSTLPIVVGNGAAVHTAPLYAALERYPALQSRVRAAVFVAERRWTLKLAEGTDIKLPENDYEQALAKLDELDRTSKIFNRAVVAIDLRIPDKVIVRLTEAATQEREDMLKRSAKRGGPA